MSAAAGSNGHGVAPGQALLRQLQMSSALSSPQHAHHHHMWPDQSSAAAPGSGWDAYPAQSTSPYFDPAIVNASSAALRETGTHPRLAWACHALNQLYLLSSWQVAHLVDNHSCKMVCSWQQASGSAGMLLCQPTATTAVVDLCFTNFQSLLQLLQAQQQPQCKCHCLPR